MYQSINSDGIALSNPVSSAEPDGFLRAYNVFSSVTATFLAAAAAASILLICFDTSLSDIVGIAHLLLRLYSLVFMCLAFTCEMEWLEIVRQSAVFQNWIVRGIFYSYMGLFTFVEYGHAKVDHISFGWVVKIVSVFILLLGLTYTILV